jgi:glycosyltransferase involved in cell wall biosynthesis
VGGVPDIVRHGLTGFVVERGDQDGLLAALAELLENPARRMEMGRRARGLVEARHSVERLALYLANLYDRVLPPQRRWNPGVIEGNPV